MGPFTLTTIQVLHFEQVEKIKSLLLAILRQIKGLRMLRSCVDLPRRDSSCPDLLQHLKQDLLQPNQLSK